MKYLKKYESFGDIKLSDIYDTYPHQDEMIWNFISPNEFDNEKFPVEVRNPIEIFNKKNINGESIKDQLENATPDQIDLINHYRKNIDSTKDSYLIMSDDILVDGYHRLSALALEGVDKVKVVAI